MPQGIGNIEWQVSVNQSIELRSAYECAVHQHPVTFVFPIMWLPLHLSFLQCHRFRFPGDARIDVGTDVDDLALFELFDMDLDGAPGVDTFRAVAPGLGHCRYTSIWFCFPANCLRALRV